MHVCAGVVCMCARVCVCVWCVWVKVSEVCVLVFVCVFVASVLASVRVCVCVCVRVCVCERGPRLDKST